MGAQPLPEHDESLPIRTLIDAMTTIGLAELDAKVALQTRVERKYLVPPGLVDNLLSTFADTTAVLLVDNQRAFQYQSVYFDSADFRLYRAAATGRRWRYKVRTRSQGNAEVMLEVKAKDGRRRTVKSRIPHQAAMSVLDAAAARFVDDVVGVADSTADLEAVLTTRYQRSTVCHNDSLSRLTLDQNVRCSTANDSTATFQSVVLETKSAGAASPFDRWLWSQGHRPVRLSKFSTALAALHPSLPSNRWHRTLGSNLLAIDSQH